MALTGIDPPLLTGTDPPSRLIHRRSREISSQLLEKLLDRERLIESPWKGVDPSAAAKSTIGWRRDPVEPSESPSQKFDAHPQQLLAIDLAESVERDGVDDHQNPGNRGHQCGCGFAATRDQAAALSMLVDGLKPLVASVGQFDGNPEYQLPFTPSAANMEPEHVDPFTLADSTD